MRKIVAALLVLAVLVTSCVVYVLLTIGAPSLASWLGKAAARAERQGQDGFAEKLYRQMLSLDDCDVRARIALAALYERQQRFSAAEALLECGIDLFPSGTELYLALAGLYVRADMPLRAAELLDGVANPYVSLTLSGKRPTVTGAPLPGRYTGAMLFTLTAEEGVRYYCEVNGVWQSYDGPIRLEPGARTVRAIAVRSDVPSRVHSWHYTLDDAVPASQIARGERAYCPHCGALLDP